MSVHGWKVGSDWGFHVKAFGYALYVSWIGGKLRVWRWRYAS